METTTRPTFEAWMIQVDLKVQARLGISVHDLPDCPFRDWYDSRVSPAKAAARAIRNAPAW